MSAKTGKVEYHKKKGYQALAWNKIFETAAYKVDWSLLRCKKTVVSKRQKVFSKLRIKLKVRKLESIEYFLWSKPLFVVLKNFIKWVFFCFLAVKQCVIKIVLIKKGAFKEFWMLYWVNSISPSYFATWDNPRKGNFSYSVCSLPNPMNKCGIRLTNSQCLLYPLST